jgi:hypothetical protein
MPCTCSNRLAVAIVTPVRPERNRPGWHRHPGEIQIQAARQSESLRKITRLSAIHREMSPRAAKPVSVAEESYAVRLVLPARLRCLLARDLCD